VIACSQKICATVKIWQSQFTNGCCDLEKWVKVKWFIWYEGHVREIHLAYRREHYGKKILNYKEILFSLEYMGKVNFSL